MKILLVSDSYGLVDGVSRSIETELQFFQDRGDTVTVISTNTAYTSTYKLSAYRNFYRVFDANPRNLVRSLRDIRFDVAYGHCVGPQGLFFLLYLSSRLGLPMVNRFTTYAPDYMVYAYPPNSGPVVQKGIRWMLTWLLGITQRRVQRVLLSVYCEKMLRYLVDNLGVKQYRIIENRFPMRSKPPLRTRPRRRTCADPIRLITPGRISAEKNIELLISVWNDELVDRYPNAEWYLVGSGPLLDTVRQRVRGPDRVRTLGEVSHQRMLREMVEADLMLYASLGDTFGLVITEAKLCRLPIIALADNAGVSAQIRDGEIGGYLATDLPGFVHRMHNALANPLQLIDIAECGADDVNKRFGCNQHHQLSDILERTILIPPSRIHRLTTLAASRIVRLLCWTLPRAFVRMYERV